MISVEHPLLPYTLEYEEATGVAVRRRTGIAEQGTTTDGLLAVMLLELQKQSEKSSVDSTASVTADEVAELKAAVESLKAEVKKLKAAK